MAHPHNITGYLLLALLLIVTVSCGSSEEVRVVESAPRTGPAADSTEEDSGDEFMQLTIGLLEPVDNFDPLFINNQSTMRALSLIYDGLFTVDADGDVLPALARDTEVSQDSLTYTIQINRDIFFHDSEAFLSGVGRRIQASDVKWAFERAARANVPDHAAKLLMNIEGYEDYFDDQRFIYDPDRRVLDEVAGITVVDEQTLRFQLIEPDPDFTKKLTSPYLFIYPREALQQVNRSLKTNPVGTGAYRFREQRDETVTFIREQSDNDSERVTSPALNRIDLVYTRQESDLFRRFAANEIDWIPEMGSETRRVAIAENGSLVPGYASQYNLHSLGTRDVYVHLNESRRSNMVWLKSRLSELEPDSLGLDGVVSVINPPERSGSSDLGEPDETYYVTYTSDPYARSLLGRIQRSLLEPDSEFGLTDIRTPVSRTSIFTVSADPFHSEFFSSGQGAWVQFSVDNKGLSHSSIEGIEEANISWKLFVEPITVNSNQGDSE